MISASERCSRRGFRGFTLIELMVTVAVLAILATIVIPAYENLIRSSRRADGRAAATAVALALERRFSVYQRYDEIDGDGSIDFNELVKEAGLEEKLKSKTSVQGYYLFDVALSTVVGQPQYVITVDPVGSKSQAADKYCTQMTLNAFGAKGGTSAGTDYEVRCW
jgi:type IV pilus assembly protein PilE